MAFRRTLPIRRPVTARRIRYAAPALEKGLDILELLASVSEALTHSEIASRLGRTITEVFRMLVCLEERGYISRTTPEERYQLTLKLFELVHHHHPLQRLVTQARPLVQRVAGETGQSCHLAMLNNAEVVLVAQADAPGNMGFSVRLGANIDLLNTASRTEYFEDYEIGAQRITSGRTITETDVVIHAGHTGDYFPHHVDAEFARATPFGQRIAHGTMTFAIGIGLTASQINPVAFTYGYDKLRFPKPVFIGDTLRTRVTIKEKQEDPKRQRLGRVVEACEVLNQRDEVVLYCEHILLAEKRSAAVTKD